MKTRMTAIILALTGIVIGGRLDAGDKKGVVVDLGGLKSLAPADWKAQKPASKFRVFQFALPGEDKEGELAIFYFDGGGGSLDANLKRWKDQMVAPKGKSIDDVSKLEKFKVGNVEVTALDMSGTFLDAPPGKKADAVRRENYRFIGIYFNHEKGPHFIRVVGPADVVEKHKKAFDGWVKNFK
ncbi:MAG: hypothetical protein HY040_02360 [Planctomycetes bacterium]|nr:hypothetical protein [Planctomycetota bacterium]